LKATATATRPNRDLDYRDLDDLDPDRDAT
jgi:hypothetical protein